ncbi:hypothetical protein SeLEV6574_g03162 [Synchytrium endobioticum]|uniref:Uncharacterized protein n=1 Tax=Synchytrium endobioticum TaxID=286115 RepID=A0A507D503_9FUNG|nr:hypothetical protein SeLEV6574_g03162 [Synchytrium endobioticum]
MRHTIQQDWGNERHIISTRVWYKRPSQSERRMRIRSGVCPSRAIIPSSVIVAGQDTPVGKDGEQACHRATTTRIYL